MKTSNNRETYERLQDFLKAVNAETYDNRRADFPTDIEIWSFEECLDGSHYLYGQLDAYVFQGYTSEKNLTGRIDWRFYGYQQFPLEFVLQLMGLAGAIACAAWVIGSWIFEVDSFKELFIEIP